MANKQSQASARVALDPVPFEDGAKAVISAANKMSAAVTAAFAAAGVAVLAAFGAKTITGLVDTLKEVILFGEQMANAGKKAGLAAGQYYLFNSALEKGIGLKTAAALLGENAGALNRSANTFRDVSIKLWVVSEKIRGFWLGLMERVTPVLSRLLDGTLGFELVSAGQAFGEQIAKAIAVIYQLAMDGDLWSALKSGFQLTFDYAAERMLWLGGIGYDIIKEMFSTAFVNGIVDGLKSAWEHMQKFIGNFAVKFYVSFYNVWTDILKMLDKWLYTIDQGLNKIHLVSTDQMNSDSIDRKKEIASRVETGKHLGGINTDAAQGKDFASKIADIFQRNQFNPSQGLSDEIDNFGKMLTEKFTKYQAGESSDPTKTFENNNRRAAFGVDSMAAIGAGGNVYLGLSVLDVNKSMLKELQSINGKMQGRGAESSYVNSGGDLQYNGISRAQTSSPVN